MAKKATLKPVALSDNARVVLERRYLAKDDDGNLLETPEQLFRRVADNIAQAEKAYTGSPSPRKERGLGGEDWPDRFYDLITSLRFLPNSPTLGNAGRPLQQLSACFVLPVEDSMASIFEAVKETALIHQSGGGTGFAFSRLRPAGDVVRSTGGVASGPVSFMRVFDAATEAIKQGGTRRGANMAILDVHHPDIEAFINLKGDMVTLTNFNISVAVDEAFMRAVETNGDFDLINPRTQAVVGTRNARAIFDTIVANAWRNGDPGLVFLDRINADNPTPALGAMEATNPCVTGDTWVQTLQGPRQVIDLVDTLTCLVVDGVAHPAVEGFFPTGRRQVYRLETVEGYVLHLTGDHRVRRVTKQTRYRQETEWAAAHDLAPGDLICLNDHRAGACWTGRGTEGEGYLLGLLLGDGNLQTDKAILAVWPQAPGIDGVKQAVLAAASELPHRSDFTGWRVTPHGNEVLVLSAVKRLAEDLGMAPGRKLIEPELEQTSSGFYKGFIRGLFDADGSVQGRQAKGVSVRLAQSNLQTLQAVQRMLLRLGIASTIYQNRRLAGTTVLPDGRGGRREYATLAQHELSISGENVARYATVVGFCDTAKHEHLTSLLGAYKRRLNRERFVARVRAIVSEGEEPVFDVSVPGANAFDANGLVVHNCGEQPLLPYESCNLGSLNLSLFVKEQGTANEEQGGRVSPSPRKERGMGGEDARVNWDALAEVIPVAVRFLDDVIDMNAYPVEAIDRQTKLTRKIGLGVMGWADMLFKLGVPYDSDEALALAGRVIAFIHEHADAASEALAGERGCFPAWEESIYGPKRYEGREGVLTSRPSTSSGRMDLAAESRSPSPRKERGLGGEDAPVRPLRNSTRTTIAPTGTLSIIADCTGGIEPAFALAYTRQHYLDPKNPAVPVRLTELNKTFEAAAKAGGFYSQDLVDHLAAGGSLRDRPDVPEDVKRRFVTAHEIAPEWHVRMQAAFQRHTDNAVSKTINFPRDAAIADVAEAYLLAYREGCKGITIYRDGSRAGQVLSHIAEGEGDLGAPPRIDGFAPHPEAPNRRHLPDERQSITHKFRVGEQEGFVTVGLFADGTPGEIFVTISKEGSTIRGLMDSVAMLTSYSLQYGVSLRTLVDKFKGVHFEPAGLTSNPEIPSASSLVDYIFRWLELRFLIEEQGTGNKEPAGEPLALRPPTGRPNGRRRSAGRGSTTRASRYLPPRPALPFSEVATGLLCPDCGSEVVFAEGCLVCRACGYTRCG